MVAESELGGALVAETVEALKKEFLTDSSQSRTFLPPERVLISDFEVSRSTMRRALNSLINSNLIRAEHGRGYRILKSSKLNNRLAILQVQDDSKLYDRSQTSESVVDAFQKQSMQSKLSVLNIDVSHLRPEDIVNELIETNVNAATLVVEDQSIIDELRKNDIACIILENNGSELDVDYITQDHFGGGRKAAQHLIDNGCKNIAWFGAAPTDSFQSMSRWLGAQSVLLKRELIIDEKFMVTSQEDRDELALKLLSGKKRPDGVLSLWKGQTEAIVKAATQLNLKIGKDIQIVGWCIDNNYYELKYSVFKDNIPPVISWSPDQMAKAAIKQLQARLENPILEYVKITIPTKLVK